MRHRPTALAALLVPVLLATAATPALADAIDGDWCSDDGRRLTISGPDIVTPAGQQAKGEYDRHHFSYVEPGGSGTISMVLISEIRMRLKPPSGDEQLWRRCGKPVS